MRYVYLTNTPVSDISVKRIPIRKKSAKPEALPAPAEVTTATANEAPDAALETTPPPSTKLPDLVRGRITDVEWGIDVVYDAEAQIGYLSFVSSVKAHGTSTQGGIFW